MKIALFIPAYRGQMQYAVHRCAVRSLRWCWERDIEVIELHEGAPWIDVMRNRAVENALARGCDYLLMQDADVYAPRDCVIERLFTTMAAMDASVVGAAVQRRGRRSDRYNCRPWNPGERYDGIVGTGLMLLHLDVLADLPARQKGGLFARTLSAKGLRVKTGEDYGFCKVARDAGLRVVVDATFVTRHIGENELESHVLSGESDWVLTRTPLAPSASGHVAASADAETPPTAPAVGAETPPPSPGAGRELAMERAANKCEGADL